MNVLAWILSGLLAFAFLGAGGMKLVTPHGKLLENPQMAWAGDFNSGQVKTIAGLEILGAIGVILPWLLDIARILTPLAALGLAATMVGALVVHGRRGELKQAVPINAFLFLLAAAVAVLRFSQL